MDSILFVTSNRVGDAVLSTGLLDHLLRTRPEATFTIVCGPAAEGVFARMPRREATFVLEKRPWRRHWLGLWRFAVRRRWNLVVDIRGSALSYLVPARARAVMRRSSGHKTAQLAALLGLAPPPLPVAWTSPADRADAGRLLPDGGARCVAPRYIALGPTANWDGKIWPPDRFAAVYREIAGRVPGAVPVVFAGPGDAERARAAPVLAALPEAIDLAGRLELPQAAACLARCAVFVGNDSGLMHLAAAAGAPTVGLFGPTPAEEYAPSGSRSVAVRSATRTMDGLDVGSVADAAMVLLSGPRRNLEGAPRVTPREARLPMRPGV